MRFGVVVAILALVGTGVTCREERICTDMGCASSVSFDVGDLPQRERLHAEGCLDDRCASLRGVLAVPEVPPRCLVSEGPRDDLRLVMCEDAAARRVPVRLELEDVDLEGSHVVRLSISTDEGVLVDITREVPFRPFRPNGPDCDPVCWVAVVRDDGS